MKSQRQDNERFAEAIGRKASRREQAKSEKKRSFWVGLGMFGMVGWNVALPALLGALAGRWLDARFQTEGFSWTLALIALGLVVGCFNAWRWAHKVMRRD